MSSKNSAKGKAANTRTVRFNIKRCDGPGQPSRWERFDVPVQSSSAGSGSANVISCLQWIAANPVTIEGKKTPNLAIGEGGLKSTLHFVIRTRGAKTQQGRSLWHWRLQIAERKANGTRGDWVREFHGRGLPPNKVIWNGICARQ